MIDPLLNSPQSTARHFSPKIIIAALFIVLTLIGGAVAYYLSTQNQEIRQQASGGNTSEYTPRSNGQCPGGYVDTVHGCFKVPLPPPTVPSDCPLNTIYTFSGGKASCELLATAVPAPQIPSDCPPGTIYSSDGKTASCKSTIPAPSPSLTVDDTPSSTACINPSHIYCMSLNKCTPGTMCPADRVQKVSSTKPINEDLAAAIVKAAREKMGTDENPNCPLHPVYGTYSDCALGEDARLWCASLVTFAMQQGLKQANVDVPLTPAVFKVKEDFLEKDAFVEPYKMDISKIKPATMIFMTQSEEHNHIAIVTSTEHLTINEKGEVGGCVDVIQSNAGQIDDCFPVVNGQIIIPTAKVTGFGDTSTYIENSQQDKETAA
jgi:hypothetical protein